MDGDEVDDHNDRDMLLLSLLLCQNAALQRGPCDLPFVWVHVRVEEACSCNGLWSLIVESLWLQWPGAAGCGRPQQMGPWRGHMLTMGAHGWVRAGVALTVDWAVPAILEQWKTAADESGGGLARYFTAW